MNFVTRKLDLDQTSGVHTCTERNKCDKTCEDIAILGLGNVDCTGWLRVGTDFYFFNFQYCIPIELSLFPKITCCIHVRMVDYGNTRITQLYNCTLVMMSVQVTGPLITANALHVCLHHVHVYVCVFGVCVCCACMCSCSFCFQYTASSISPKEQLLQKVLQPKCTHIFVCMVCWSFSVCTFCHFCLVFQFYISLFQYFNSRKHYWAVEGDIKTDIGDIILIERLPQKMTPLVSHRIKEQVFKLGAVVDPVTGQRCRGTSFIDEEMRQLETEQIEEERAKKVSSTAPPSWKQYLKIQSYWLVSPPPP